MVVKEFDTLYARSSGGKIKTWKISVLDEGDHAVIRKEHGYLLGKLQVTDKKITKGKNLGKANATTYLEQALSDAQSDYNKKLDKKYITEYPTGENEPDIILPMTAQPFKKRKHNITYPCYVQPKLNGVRCLAKKVSDTEMHYISRGGKFFTTVEHMTPKLLELLRVDEIFDGEIFHPSMTFQEIIRNVKKQRETSSLLQFWVYNVADADSPFLERLASYECRIETSDEHPITKVDTILVQSEEDIYKLHDEYVAMGLEGAIIRNLNGFYKFDHRSADLQKYKEFEDKEFKIIGGVSGTGLEEGCVVFICVNEDGKEFNCRPKGSRELRKHWLDNIDDLIGLDLTVRFQDRTEDNIPSFPVGVAIRNYE